jgi:hypothetical protein
MGLVTMKFCIIPELLIIPVPLTVNINVLGTVMVKALAPGSKVIAFTSAPAEIEIAVILEWPNVAMSFGPFGTVLGVQFAGLFQLLSTGSRFQVALPAWATWPAKKQRDAVATNSPNIGREQCAFMLPFRPIGV